MTNKYDQSSQWAHITNTLITEGAAADLSNFKTSSINYKMALWDPQPNGIRYLKELIYNLGVQLTPENRARLHLIRNRDVGNPISVKYAGEALCIDYLQAVYELEFISNVVELGHANVLEIGAGYGRTCHAMISNHDIASYSIIDLPNPLEVARKYLRIVLDERQFSKISFVRSDDVASLPEGVRYDLCVNINAFGEMTGETVRNYLHFIAGHCDYFYTKNQVGKYLDKSLDGHSQGDEVVAYALSSGPLRDIIDIYDSNATEAQRPKFIDAYRPGREWVCVADGWGIPWAFYWQAVYHRISRG
jgi:putative sugar O-methyltransferase